MVRTRGKGRPQENVDFWTQQGSWIHEFTGVVTTQIYANSCQTYLSMEGGSEHKVLPHLSSYGKVMLLRVGKS